MDSEAFVRWALDDSRTLEERYTTELIVELGVGHWNSRQRIYTSVSIDAIIERRRQRALNPAYEPHYDEEAVRRAAEAWPEIKGWSEFNGLDHRPIRDIQVLRFLPHLEDVRLQHCEVSDLAPMGELRRLRTLHFSSSTCSDFRPLAGCTALRNLDLEFVKHWPDVRGLAGMPEVETLLLKGNLLVFERALWPKVKSAALQCGPLHARNVRDLPQLPNCEILFLGGVESLDGIDAFPALRNLTLTAGTESFEPLVSLTRLTCLTSLDFEPVDVAPLARVPRLQFLRFDSSFRYSPQPIKPRDLAPLVESSSLRELCVRGSPVIETEAAGVQAGLPSWDDLFLLSEPRVLPPLRMIAAHWRKTRSAPEISRLPGEPESIDTGLRQCELCWAARYLQRAITRKLGTSDWGEVDRDYPRIISVAPYIISPTHRRLSVEFHSFGLLDKYPLFIEAIHECLAHFVADYHVGIWNRLKAPRPDPTPAQIEMEKKFEREQDDADFERRQQEREEYLDRLHRYEIKKQDGAKVDPAEFAPGPQQPLPPPPWECDEDDEEDDDDDSFSDVATKKDIEPPPSWEDDEHPLAEKYHLMADLVLGEFWVLNQERDLAEYLLHRTCDEVIPDEEND